MFATPLVDCLLFTYLSTARAWLLDHLMPSLPVPTDDVISRIFIEFSALERVVAIHPGMNTERPYHVSIQAKALEIILPKSHVRWLGESGEKPPLSPGALGYNPYA
ncbi:uncharacterized protein TNCV_3507701 [Trichonephila clavipes]|uniref:Uncharacterized protein n=1 Tax=Trichonephila clavipes TaxID=2585209 RepID=A0A8X6S1R8_TRICX|nr:uncharacterized protein TNCV_3507701 [Trichonephila clavipes]